jgi:hypothetical protein
MEADRTKPGGVGMVVVSVVTARSLGARSEDHVESTFALLPGVFQADALRCRTRLTLSVTH